MATAAETAARPVETMSAALEAARKRRAAPPKLPRSRSRSRDRRSRGCRRCTRHS